MLFGRHTLQGHAYEQCSTWLPAVFTYKLCQKRCHNILYWKCLTASFPLVTGACRTCLAVAGADYCIVAASTRMSTGYSILTRRSSKILTL